MGQVKDTIKFEIELALVKDGLIDTSCSAGQILNLSNRDDAILLNFPVGPTDRHQCVVASIEMLEVIKCSHIYWPFYFPKHIADLHTLRALLPSTSPSVNLGIRADKTKPLTPPARSPELEGLLITRTLETGAFRGTPGAHINLNVSNEDSLGRDDDLFVTRHVPHDDVHHLVKYGDTPIYNQVDALGLQDLTQDLFMTYVVALVQPRFLGNGDTPLAADINRKKVAGRIPLKSQNQLWFDLWKYNL